MKPPPHGHQRQLSTHKRAHRWGWCIAVAGLALVLTACGDDRYDCTERYADYYRCRGTRIVEQCQRDDITRLYEWVEIARCGPGGRCSYTTPQRRWQCDPDHGGVLFEKTSQTSPALACGDAVLR